MTTLQLPEGYTVRKVGNSLKVVPMRKRRVVATVKEKEMDLTSVSMETKAQKATRMAAVEKENEALRKEYFAKKAAEEAEKAQKAAEIFANPPSLRGSVKQIEWASKIRGAYIEFYQVRRREWCAQEVIEHTDAKYWIDNRYGMGVTNSDQRAIQSLMYSK